MTATLGFRYLVLICTFYHGCSLDLYERQDSGPQGNVPTKLDKALVGKTNCGAAVCCSNCQQGININFNFGRIAQAIGGLGAGIKQVSSDIERMEKDIAEGLKAIANGIKELTGVIAAMGAAFLSDLGRVEAALKAEIDLSILTTEVFDAIEHIKSLHDSYMKPLMSNPHAFEDDTLKKLQADILDPLDGIGFQLQKISDAMSGGLPGLPPVMQIYKDKGLNLVQLGKAYGFFLTIQTYGFAQLYWAELKTFGGNGTIRLDAYNQTNHTQSANLGAQLFESWGAASYLWPCTWDFDGIHCPEFDECDWNHSVYRFGGYVCNSFQGEFVAQSGNKSGYTLETWEQTFVRTRNTNVTLKVNYNMDFPVMPARKRCLLLAESFYEDTDGSIKNKSSVWGDDLPVGSAWDPDFPEFCTLSMWANHTQGEVIVQLVWHVGASPPPGCDEQRTCSILASLPPWKVAPNSPPPAMNFSVADNGTWRVCAGVDHCISGDLFWKDPLDPHGITWGEGRIIEPVAYHGCHRVFGREFEVVSSRIGMTGLMCAGLCQLNKKYVASSCSAEGVCSCAEDLPDFQHDNCGPCSSLPVTWCALASDTAAVYIWGASSFNSHTFTV